MTNMMLFSNRKDNPQVSQISEIDLLKSQIKSLLQTVDMLSNYITKEIPNINNKLDMLLNNSVSYTKERTTFQDGVVHKLLDMILNDQRVKNLMALDNSRQHKKSSDAPAHRS